MLVCCGLHCTPHSGGCSALHAGWLLTEHPWPAASVQCSDPGGHRTETGTQSTHGAPPAACTKALIDHPGRMMLGQLPALSCHTCMMQSQSMLRTADLLHPLNLIGFGVSYTSGPTALSNPHLGSQHCHSTNLFTSMGPTTTFTPSPSMLGAGHKGEWYCTLSGQAWP